MTKSKKAKVAPPARRGRPPLNEGVSMESTVAFRLRPDTRQAAQEAAQDCGLTLGQLLRKVIERKFG